MIFLGKLITVFLIGKGLLNVGIGSWIAETTATKAENARLSAH